MGKCRYKHLQIYFPLHFKIYKTMNQKEKIERVRELLSWLSFDHQRMSSSGQQFYEEICKLLDIKL